MALGQIVITGIEDGKDITKTVGIYKDVDGGQLLEDVIDSGRFNPMGSGKGGFIHLGYN